MVQILKVLQKQDERLKNIETLLSQSKKILNLSQVSKFTGLSKSTIYKFTHQGKIPFYKQAKHLYFDKQEIENWLKESRGYNVAEIKANAFSHLSIKKGN